MRRLNRHATPHVIAIVTLLFAFGVQKPTAAIAVEDVGSKPLVDHVKWSQPPVEVDPRAETPLFCGWDEPSFYMISPEGLSVWTLAADDFRCLGTMPVSSVHWWGSYKNWDGPEPPEPRPSAWRISFWTNVPEHPQTEPGYSYPRSLLWQIEVPADRVHEEPVGRDYFSAVRPITCFRYFVQLEPEEYFRQDDFAWDIEDNVFWISIAAVYPDVIEVPDRLNTWGWRTRPQHWLDDAVRFTVHGDLVRWLVNPDPFAIEPLESDQVCDTVESYDMAFELDTEPNYVKWEQAFTGLRDWPHYEDEKSMAVEAADGVPVIRRLVADDWRCRGTIPVTALAWWGSYIGYRYHACDCQQMPAPRRPDYFLLSMWTDVPDPNADDPETYSHPGEKVWEYKAYARDSLHYGAYSYSEVLVGYDKHPEDDPADPAHEPVFRYSVRLPEDSWFCQEEDDDVYWLSVVAVYEDPESVNYPWGWTNHKCTLWDPPGLEEVLHWAMDDTAGTVAADSSGNSNHGTLVGDASWQTCCGRTCGAVDLDGNGDYVKIDAPVGLDFAPGSFTASAWVNARDVSDGWRTIMEYDRDGSNLNRFGLWLGAEGRFHFRVGHSTADSAQVLAANSWYLLTGVYDGDPNKMRLYVNGQFDSEALLTKGYLSANAANLTVGVRGSQDAEYFDGLVDDVRIYDYALSAKQVQALYEAARNDDAVAGYVDPAGPEDIWVWEELYDQVGMSEDMSFILFTEPGCYPFCMPDYFEWLALGKPECWCYPRQCHGDTDGKTGGSPKTGVYYVGPADLNLLVAGWLVTEPPHGPGIASIPDGICADFAHDIGGSPKTGQYRVGPSDLNIFINNWLVREPPHGPGVSPDCTDCTCYATSRPMSPTQCPAVKTRCPSVETRCPAVETKCPPVETRCPVMDTRCPSDDTRCPPEETRCPPMETECVAITMCPPTETTCPALLTVCPVAETKCPEDPTRCPPVETRCPALLTVCPVAETKCPEDPTRCPPAETQCPPRLTECPAEETVCPAELTRCPVHETRCPPEDTRCPAKMTNCPPEETKCPPVRTKCPAEETKCPEDPTRCPPVETECPPTPTECHIEDTVCPVFDTRCPAVETKCPPTVTECRTVITTCPTVPTECPEDPTRCPPVPTQCPGEDTICPRDETRCPPIDTRCPPVPTECLTQITVCPPAETRCPQEDTKCPVRYTLCPPEETKCPQEDTKCPPEQTQCPESETKCPEVATKCPFIDTQCPRCGEEAAQGLGVGYGAISISTRCPALDVPCPSVVPEHLLARAR